MASKKKLIQFSKTANILQEYRYILFIQQTQKRKLSSLKLGKQSLEKHIHIFQYKNTIIQKFLAHQSFLLNNEYINSTNKKNDFLNVFQGPNMLLAGNDLTELPSLWKSLNSIPHLFFCGAIIDKTAYNHLDLEKGIECVYNTSSQEVYSRLLDTLTPAAPLDELSYTLEREIENVWSALLSNTEQSTIQNLENTA